MPQNVQLSEIYCIVVCSARPSMVRICLLKSKLDFSITWMNEIYFCLSQMDIYYRIQPSWGSIGVKRIFYPYSNRTQAFTMIIDIYRASTYHNHKKLKPQKVNIFIKAVRTTTIFGHEFVWKHKKRKKVTKKSWHTLIWAATLSASVHTTHKKKEKKCICMAVCDLCVWDEGVCKMLQRIWLIDESRDQ